MPTPESSQLISRLREHLCNLPADLPLGSHRQYPFSPFSYDQDRLDATEDLAGTVGHVFKQAFGWRAEQPLVLRARGRQIEATADVLELYIAKCPDNAGILVKWAEDLLSAAQDACNDDYALQVSLNDGKPLTPKQIKAPSGSSKSASSLTQSTLLLTGRNSLQIKKGDSNAQKRKTPDSDDEEEEGDDDDEICEPRVWVYRGKRYPLKDAKEMENDKGRPALVFLRKASQKCKTEGFPGGEKTRYRCISDNCSRSWSSRTHDRIGKHTVKCRHVPEELRHLASLEMIKKAPSVLAAEAAALPNEPDGVPKAKKLRFDKNAEPETPTMRQKSSLYAIVGQAGQQQVHTQLDVKHTYLFCQAGLPLHVADLLCWRDAWKVAVPYYKVPTASKLADGLIPSEASHIRSEKMKFLSTQTGGITLSFDSGSTTHQSFTSISAITASRRSFLLEMPDGSMESHTGEYYKTLMEKWILTLGPLKIVAIVSDNASNARLGRSLVQATYPTIQNLPDACHKLNSLIGDICALDELRKPIVIARKIINHFHHSLQSTLALKEALNSLGINSSLKTIGNTRFANVLWAIEALVECLPGLRKVVSNGGVVIKDCDRILRSGTTSTVKFELELKQVCAVLAPAARSIVCLESPFATPADVYMHWLGLASWYRNILKDDTIDLESETVQGIVSLYNRRFKEMIDDAPCDIYYTAFCLDPRWRHSAILGKSNQLATTISLPALLARNHSSIGTSSNIHTPRLHPKAYARLGRFLYSMVGQQREYDKSLKLKTYLTEHKTSQLKQQFDSEMEAYSQGHHPYVHHDKSEAAHDWWQRIGRNDPTLLLPVFACRLYDICPNSMVDERVMSNVTWLHSPLRNRQLIELTSNMIEIRQWANFSEQATFKDFGVTTGHRPDPPLINSQLHILDGAMLDLLESTVNGLQALHGVGSMETDLCVDPDISVESLDELRELLDPLLGKDLGEKAKEDSQVDSTEVIDDDEDGDWGEWQPNGMLDN